jgi:hypothetical protein
MREKASKKRRESVTMVPGPREGESLDKSAKLPAQVLRGDPGALKRRAEQIALKQAEQAVEQAEHALQTVRWSLEFVRKSRE